MSNNGYNTVAGAVPETVGEVVTQKYSNGAAHVTGLASKTTVGPETAGTYNATEIIGFNVLNVGSADSWVLTYVDGGVSTIGFGDMREDYFPSHLSSLLIPTGGVAEVFIL
jgi:hypothetical protein